jgi:ATP-binding cassette subfamily A (ABC1) protein 3
MEEASVLGKRIGIISSGKMKCIGTPLFLIERFGKYLSLNLSMEEDADTQSIINFFEKTIPNIDYEILSEEILFRIPKKFFSGEDNNSINEDTLLVDDQSESKKKKKKKTKEINKEKNAKASQNLTNFFENLDKNLKNLKIKSYSASMPTLEDVFLNVASDNNELKNKTEENVNNNLLEKAPKKHRKFSLINVDNDKILFETDYKEDYSKKSKFCNDFTASFWRRFLLTTRDLKGFLMEILCPILLVLVGLLVSKIDLIKRSNPEKLDMNIIGKQKILFVGDSGINLEKYYFTNMQNVTCDTLPDFQVNSLDKKTTIRNFVEKMYSIVKDKEDSKDNEVDMMSDSYTGYYGSVLLFKDGTNKDEINFIEVLNTRPTHVVPIYTYYFLKQFVEVNTGVSINYIHYPFPLTAELDEQSDQTSNSLMVFFVAISFSLIPGNFVTIIVKEKVNNSKHLLRVSGISIAAYWLVNYIYELSKYYLTCGICLILLWRFDFYKEYLYILYLIYGPSMVSLTYILSFLFDSESGAQNAIILLNFLIGALGSSVILMLRLLDNVKKIAKIIQYIISLLPSFCFNFGYSMLLNKIMILAVDYPNEWFTFTGDVMIKKFNLLLSAILYLSIEIVVYTLILIIIETFSYSSSNVSDSKIDTNVQDSKVLKEIERANKEVGPIEIYNNQNEPKTPPIAVRIKNLQKKYSTGLCSSTTAIRNMNFCVEPGECFGLLGLNGAGKTTTFKCITQEISPSHGKIFINGKDMRNSFSELSTIFGYCPQFDAIFEYMTVYENLKFYGRIKGIKSEYLDQVVNSMIDEMSLSEFTNKIAGRLSGGNKRKLSVAISFLGGPPIVLLDEPSTGMDPEARRFMWSVIHKISKKGKKASVIMTTHSMDEAETLCKRMAIMVNGEFVCLGKEGEIKQKYGYGYELEVRIKPLSEAKFMQTISNYSIDKHLKINMNNINEILIKLGYENYINELQKGRFGSKLIRDIQMSGEVPIRTLISWTFFVKNALKFIRDAMNYFETIILTEYIDNNFLFKMKKNEKTKSIGFLFGLFENNKDSCNVTEYSIQQTSLEQIFNMFDDKQRKINSNEQEEKQEIIINEDIFNSLLKK